MLRFLSQNLLLLVVLHCVACGVPLVEDAGQGVADAAKAVGEAATGTASRLDDAINERPIGLRKRKCDEAGGRWAEKIEVTPCIDQIAHLTIDGIDQEQVCDTGEGDSFEWMCTFEDANGKIYFADGPSIPPSILAASALMGDDADQIKYTDLFFEAGVQHDYCYHHSPMVDGVTQERCDQRFFDDLASVCHAAVKRDLTWFSQDMCRGYAAMLYGALRAAGKSSFNVMNTKVSAPAYVPAWQTLELDAQPDDQDLREKVDELLGKLSLDG